MRVAINLLTEDPTHPSGTHWFWTNMIPEMARRLREGEEIHLLTSPKSRPHHSDYGPGVHYITYPWSNERPKLRTLADQVYSPMRLPMSGITVYNTLIAPWVRPAPGVVAHFKTMHAFTQPEALRPLPRWYRQRNYPRTVRMADAIIINSESIRAEINQHLDVDPEKLRYIPEAVDHEMFRPGDTDAARDELRRRYGITGPFVLFVSSLWRYKNADGLIRAFARAKPHLAGHRLVMVGFPRDESYARELRELADSAGVADDVVWVGGLPLADTVPFYRAADAFVYPSFNETWGLPILEAMACSCPVITSNCTSMPETAGGAALLIEPSDPDSIADAIIEACGERSDELRKGGVERAGQLTWATTAARTVEVYREVHELARARAS